jgi:hypothetical protein
VIDYLSHSRLKAYGCPYRFQQLCIRNTEEPSGRAALVGREFHQLVAGHLADECELPPGTTPHDETGCSPLPDIMDEAEDLFSRWMDEFQSGGLTALGIEVACEAVLDDLTAFRGHIDYACDWQGMLVLYDWKTSRHMPTSLASDPQLASYAWLACEKWPEYAEGDVLLRQFYARFGRYLELKISPVGRRNVAYTLSRFAERLNAADPKAEWPASPCDQCAWCSLVCPLGWSTLRPPQTDEDAEKLAGQLYALECQHAAARDALRAWCDEHGPVEGAGRVYSINQGEKAYCPLSARDLFERYGETALDWLVPGKALVDSPPDGLELRTKAMPARFSSKKATNT